MIQSKEIKEERVSPDIYSRHYFLTDNEGWDEYLKGLDDYVHPKFKRALELGRPSKGDAVLDIGCGRGELLYYCARRGAKIQGIDYSRAAIDIAKDTIEKLPEGLRHLARAEIGDVVTYDFHEKYDIVFMIEILEHMHTWQLTEAFKKINEILSDKGKLVVITPNYYYEKYLSPVKGIIEMPWNLIKIPLRILRGKYRPKTIKEALRKIFRIRLDRGKLNKLMHVSVAKPSGIKKILSSFNTKIRCEDHSKNLISLITQRWWGRDIVVVASKR